jgi:4-amino-4-deoxy-L-arabinose transferase-like glycosyltransferase
MYSAPGYGFFGDELYTIALSRHLAFGYVDLPPLVPALVALSRALLGESLFALHIVPALAGALTLVCVCLITKEFGGKAFAVMLSAMGFIFVPLWLGVDSIFCYDSIDQLILAGFLYTLVRFLRSGNRRLWLVLGLIAGVAGLTKMTILFLGPGFLAALLISKYRKDLLTPWPWLGGALCVVIVTPYLLWQIANQWPTLEYWTNYGTVRVYQASIPQYLTNILVYMNPFFLPLWIAGLYRLFRRLNGVNYGFLGVLFLVTLVLEFSLHATVRMLIELFIPLIAAGAVFVEEKLAGIRWEKAV